MTLIREGKRVGGCSLRGRNQAAWWSPCSVLEAMRNLLYFEAPSMKELFAEMDEWQATHRKRLQSVSIQPDGDSFAAIALSNPTEVIIVNGYGNGGVSVGNNSLAVLTPPFIPLRRLPSSSSLPNT